MVRAFGFSGMSSVTSRRASSTLSFDSAMMVRRAIISMSVPRVPSTVMPPQTLSTPTSTVAAGSAIRTVLRTSSFSTTG
jgi:hypothetical protein